MYSCMQIIADIENGAMDERLRRLYALGPDEPVPERIKRRYIETVARYMERFSAPPESPVMMFSAPGRTEVGGNHTDHQHGRVLCSGVDLDMLACAAPNGSGYIKVASEGYAPFSVTAGRSLPDKALFNSSPALVAGLASAVAERGYEVIGLDVYVCSDIPLGSGLSSSAAYEVLMGSVLNYFCCESRLSPVELASIGQYAENVFFGKPCGLMDQVASAIGELSAIDFLTPSRPAIESLSCDLGDYGYALCIIDTGADHSDLTADYGAIPGELAMISSRFGKSSLREVDEQSFYRRVPELRACAGDRAVLRAIHIFEENRRVERQVSALRKGDFGEFLRAVSDSGRSSWMYLQNVIPCGAYKKQEVALALALCERLLAGRGASRVHGGGFAGTVQAFVPLDMLGDFRRGMEEALGVGSVRVLRFRAVGGCAIEP